LRMSYPDMGQMDRAPRIAGLAARDLIYPNDIYHQDVVK
jgi:hypothetical protein